MPGTPQTLPVPPPVSIPTLLNAIRLAAASGGGGGGGGGGSGTVTSVSVTPQNGVSATVANATTTPALAFTLGNITPTTVQLSGAISGTTLLQSPPVAGSAVITFPSLTGTLAIIGNPLSQFAATTSAQLAGVISDETGSGSLVFATSPTLVTPNLGVPTSGTLTNCTGLPTAGLVDDAVTLAKMAPGTAGNLITYDASGNPAAVATGTAGQVLTSNGAGAAPTMQNASGGLTNITETLHTASPNNTVNMVRLSVTAPSTNAGLVLTPKGTGPLIGWGGVPDSSTPGGNVRGEYAIDLQGFPKNVATRVASGNYSALIGGFSGTASAEAAVVVGGTRGLSTGSNAGVLAGLQSFASGTYAVVVGGSNGSASGESAGVLGGSNGNASGSQAVILGGVSNFAAGNSAVAHGRNASAPLYGQHSHASGQFAAAGDAQRVNLVVRNKTTTNAAVELFLDGSSTRLTIPSGKAMHATVKIIGIKSDGSATAVYLRQVAIKNVSGTTSLVGSVNTIGTDTAAGTSISITADDTNDALKIEVTGITSETWRWVATVEGVEVAYGN